MGADALINKSRDDNPPPIEVKPEDWGGNKTPMDSDTAAAADMMAGHPTMVDKRVSPDQISEAKQSLSKDDMAQLEKVRQDAADKAAEGLRRLQVGINPKLSETPIYKAEELDPYRQSQIEANKAGANLKNEQAQTETDIRDPKIKLAVAQKKMTDAEGRKLQAQTDLINQQAPLEGQRIEQNISESKAREWKDYHPAEAAAFRMQMNQGSPEDAKTIIDAIRTKAFDPTMATTVLRRATPQMQALLAQEAMNQNVSLADLGKEFNYAKQPKTTDRLARMDALDSGLKSLAGLAEKVGNGDYPDINTAINKVGLHMGDSNIVSLKNAIQEVGAEYAYLIQGGVPHNAQIERQFSNMNENMPAPQLAAATQTLSNMMDLWRKSIKAGSGMYAEPGLKKEAGDIAKSTESKFPSSISVEVKTKKVPGAGGFTIEKVE